MDSKTVSWAKAAEQALNRSQGQPQRVAFDREKGHRPQALGSNEVHNHNVQCRSGQGNLHKALPRLQQCLCARGGCN